MQSTKSFDRNLKALRAGAGKKFHIEGRFFRARFSRRRPISLTLIEVRATTRERLTIVVALVMAAAYLLKAWLENR
jgi:hypothetical protein